MAKEPFEKMDEYFMKRLKGARHKNVPEATLRDFSRAVRENILKKEEKKTVKLPRLRFFAPVWVPTFAVLVIASLVIFRIPFADRQLAGLPGHAVSLGSGISDIAEEIAVLRELGVWTDKDESEIDPSMGESLDVLEV